MLDPFQFPMMDPQLFLQDPLQATQCGDPIFHLPPPPPHPPLPYVMPPHNGPNPAAPPLNSTPTGITPTIPPLFYDPPADFHSRLLTYRNHLFASMHYAQEPHIHYALTDINPHIAHATFLLSVAASLRTLGLHDIARMLEGPILSVASREVWEGVGGTSDLWMAHCVVSHLLGCTRTKGALDRWNEVKREEERVGESPLDGFGCADDFR